MSIRIFYCENPGILYIVVALNMYHLLILYIMYVFMLCKALVFLCLAREIVQIIGKILSDPYFINKLNPFKAL